MNLNGEIKVGIIPGAFINFGLRATGSTFINPPKYLVYVGDSFEYFDKMMLIGREYSLDNIYNSQDGFNIWYSRLEQFKIVRSAIYRWDSTKNKYMFESIATLEDWLKTHPIETL